MFLISGKIDEKVPADNAYVMKQALLDADVDFSILNPPTNPHRIDHPSAHSREFQYSCNYPGALR